jgi:membrane-associated phospholipid phosphatase
MPELAILRTLDHLIWALIAGAAVIVLAAPFGSNFYIEVNTFAAPLGACLALAAAAWFYRNWRQDQKLAAGLESTSQVIAFATVGAPLSYLAAAADLPLRDYAFDAIDRSLGLDWAALLTWMNQRPTLYAVLHPIYLSLTIQMTIAVLCLAFSGRLLWLRIYTLAFVLAALVTIALSVVLPAAGVWPHLGLTASGSPHIMPAVNTSWPVFFGLRDGSFRALVAIGSEGIITFPSLHAALAVILIGALWPMRILRWVALALNTAMLVATPVDGSHYFIDVLTGIAIGILVFVAAHAIATRSRHAPASMAAGKLPQLASGE